MSCIDYHFEHFQTSRNCSKARFSSSPSTFFFSFSFLSFYSEHFPDWLWPVVSFQSMSSSLCTVFCLFLLKLLIALNTVNQQSFACDIILWILPSDNYSMKIPQYHPKKGKNAKLYSGEKVDLQYQSQLVTQIITVESGREDLLKIKPTTLCRHFIFKIPMLAFQTMRYYLSYNNKKKLSWS